MAEQKYWVVGNTHVDMAWKKNRHEMAEVLDAFLARLLDILDSHPTYTYTIEQAAEYRLLAVRRPDLFARVKEYLHQGRLEMVGGMASSMETNFPSGESFVRNQRMGLRWVKQHLEADVRTAWLIDTFGINAQIPQILRQFGFGRLLANRFGGKVNQDVFWSKGLDGTQVLVAGRDVYSPFVEHGHVYWSFTRNWEQIDRLFQQASEAEGSGPFLITAYTENEVLPSLRPDFYVKQGNKQGQEGLWRYSTFSAFFDALEALDAAWPVMHGDLNPEFTATFSQRILIRLRNRAVETTLLEAEKWAALTRLHTWQAPLEEAWWGMAYVQFHDVFTGSHPTDVFLDLLASLDHIEAIATEVLERALRLHAPGLLPMQQGGTLHVFNGLPWERTDLICFPLPDGFSGVQRVLCEEQEVAFDLRDGRVRVMATTPAMGSQIFSLEPGAAAQASSHIVESGTIENEFILVECDARRLIKRLVWKETGATILENAMDLLSVQRDNGSFQIEDFQGDEIPATVGRLWIEACEPSAIAQRLILKGAFPQLNAIGDAGFLNWEAELEVRNGKPALYVQLRIDWQGEASRLRFNLATNIKSFDGIYEIPFGTVHRGSYRERGTAKGEWPAQRFVVVEDQSHGLALINTGAAGVEVSGGRISTTILRAPKSEYAGMVVDDTSSQHGQHTFDFVVQPYSGHWPEKGVVQLAQEANEKLRAIVYPHANPQQSVAASWMRLAPSSAVLSAVKAAEEGADELIVRLYETAGRSTLAELWVRGAQQAWKSDLQEEARYAALSCSNETITIPMQPYEIVTIKVNREGLAL
ncbi:MAG: alpha-mannosidase [Caldilineaceae bacterium]|nr:alpha-mannosidase [Caldilineaceae bacterium]